jgi:hypothetical protein
MGYYMRFISNDERKLSLKELESALKEYDSSYKVERGEDDDSEGTLTYADGVYGQLEVNEKRDGVFEDEIEMLKENVENTEGENKQRVLDVLEKASSLLFVRVLNQGRSDEETLEKINPIWGWLFKNRNGLAHADYEGYYDDTGLIFEVD